MMETINILPALLGIDVAKKTFNVTLLRGEKKHKIPANSEKALAN
ncbi:MAG: hypothetical protein U0X75_17565 [Acidobacteriota bacterium]